MYYLKGCLFFLLTGDRGLAVAARRIIAVTASFACLNGHFAVVSLAYDITNRWTSTITDGSGHARGDALTLLWSVVPDGESWSRGGPSDLIDYLDVGWNVPAIDRVPDLTNRPWWSWMDRVYEQYERVSGLTLTYVAEQDQSGADSGLFGDLRIGGVPFTWENNKGGVLADNAFPNNGDMRIDTYRGNDGVPGFSHTTPSSFRNLISHESGHGVGLSHSAITGANSVMETPLESNFWGLQFDDVYAFNRLYGDPLEKNGGNDTFSSSYDFGRLDPGSSVVLGTDASGSSNNELDSDWLGIDGNTDEDWFSFLVTEPLRVDITVSPLGPSYTTTVQGNFNGKQRSDLNFQFYDTNGTTVLTTIDETTIGEIEQLSGFLIEPGRYYVRVDGETDLNQFYQIELGASTSVPENLKWVGRFGNSWDNQITSNFADDSGFTTFASFDNVTFDDSSIENYVVIPASISVGSIVVDAASDYVFAGAGGITDASLTVNGPGTLELANPGNTYAGPTTVSSGTLIVTSSTGTGTTLIATGALLTGDGSVQGHLENAGEIRPGSSLGVLTVLGDTSLEPTSDLSIEIGSSSHDVLDVVGVLTISGQLSVSLIDGYVPSGGETFDILNFGSVFGEFELYDLPTLDLGLFWDTSALTSTGTLTVATGLQGDFDEDGDVDGADFLIWQRGFGTPSGASVSDGDADLDGDVDTNDLSFWQMNYSTSLSASVAALPEPSAFILYALGVVLQTHNRTLRRMA